MKLPLGKPFASFVKMGFLRRLVRAAEIWQGYHRRDLQGSMGKVREELKEFRQADTYANTLDELGDVVVNVLRALSTLTEREFKFLVQVMEMKAARRTLYGKDKAQEAIVTKKLAKKYLKEDALERITKVLE